MCDKSVDSYPHALEFVPECYKNKKRVIKLLMLTLLQLNISLIDLRLNKYMIKPLINVLLHLILFSINKWNQTWEKCDKIVSRDPLKLKYCHDKYKNQEVCNKAIDDFLRLVLKRIVMLVEPIFTCMFYKSNVMRTVLH